MLASLVRKFLSNPQGNIAIIFGFALIPFMLAVGLAIDFGQSVRTKSDIQLALDAAALATATQTGMEDADRIAFGELMFHQNFDSQAHGVNATPNIQIVSNKIVASATATLNNSFMKLAGHSGTDVATSVEVPLAGIAKAEVVLVLDYSSSMNSAGKWQAMRDAAVDLVTHLSTLR